MSPSGPIVIVRTGDPVPSVAATRGSFAELIERAASVQHPGGFEVFDIRTEAPPDPRSAAAFIITGSAANVPIREPWMLVAEAWLREVVSAGTPTLGICFGHQMLAQALGGDVQKNPRGREIGTIRIERVAEDPLFDGLPATFEVNATHIDTVVVLPPRATALARSPLDDHQAIRFTETCYGVQFHPEIDADVMRAYFEARREILATERLEVDAMLAGVTHAHEGRQILRNFLQHIVRRG
jgi:GMP synthase (glutamine-hydrolysing)